MSDYRADHTASGIVDGNTPLTRDEMVHLAKQYLHLSNRDKIVDEQFALMNKEIKELNEYIAKLKAVIADVPELFARVTRRSDDGDEYYEADTDSEPTNKSQLLKKHGVEV